MDSSSQAWAALPCLATGMLLRVVMAVAEMVAAVAAPVETAKSRGWQSRCHLGHRPSCSLHTLQGRCCSWDLRCCHRIIPPTSTCLCHRSWFSWPLLTACRRRQLLDPPP
jgi:hypothetical protein